MAAAIEIEELSKTYRQIQAAVNLTLSIPAGQVLGLLDWGLPGLAAVELLPALRRACPDLAVIALSARSATRRVVLAAGADAFVARRPAGTVAGGHTAC